MLLRFQKSTKVASLTEGAVQSVTGVVSVPKMVKVSGTDIQCACFWMITEAYKKPARKKGRKLWMPIGVNQGCDGFFVEDDTGKVWIPNAGDALDIRSGWEDRGIIGKKALKRFVSRSIKAGDTVKIRGTVSKSKGAEPGDCLVLRPDAKGRISIIQKKKAKK